MNYYEYPAFNRTWAQMRRESAAEFRRRLALLVGIAAACVAVGIAIGRCL